MRLNGSLNILRKYIKEIFSPDIEITMDIGREQRTLKKRVAPIFTDLEKCDKI